MAVPWDAAVYRANSSMQLRLAQEFLGRIRLRGDERVLDVGCGDGRVTALVADLLPAGRLVGVDASPEMIELARREHPDVEFRVADAAELPFAGVFDVALSFSALHWLRDRQLDALRSVRRALVSGGLLVVQLPGAGNLAALRGAAEAVMAEPPYRAAFAGFAFPWLFPAAAAYRALLEEARLTPVRVVLSDRDVTHEGAEGLAGWMRATWMPYTQRLPADAREGWIAQVVARYTETAPPDAAGLVHVPSVRLEVEALRPPVGFPAT